MKSCHALPQALPFPPAFDQLKVVYACNLYQLRGTEEERQERKKEKE